MKFNIGDRVFFLINSPVFGTISKITSDNDCLILTDEQSTILRPFDEIQHIPNPLKIIPLNDLIRLRELAGASML